MSLDGENDHMKPQNLMDVRLAFEARFPDLRFEYGQHEVDGLLEGQVGKLFSVTARHPSGELMTVYPWQTRDIEVSLTTFERAWAAGP